jgi:hypothetical protein
MANGHGVAGLVDRSVVSVGDADHPPLLGRRSGHGQIAPEVDQDPGPGGRGGCLRAPIGATGLGRGSQVDTDTRWKRDGLAASVEPHAAPPGDSLVADLERGSVGRYVGEVTVIAAQLERVAHGGIDDPLGQVCGLERFLQGHEEGPGHLDRSA